MRFGPRSREHLYCAERQEWLVVGTIAVRRRGGSEPKVERDNQEAQAKERSGYDVNNWIIVAASKRRVRMGYHGRMFLP